MDVQVEEAWRAGYPGASVGVLVMEGVENPPEHRALTERVRRIEEELRERWGTATRADLNQLPEFEAYRGYYRRFDKTYHVQLQFESVVRKGKPLRSNGALVLAMFGAELHNRLLTAGHDLATIEGGLTVGVARGGETYVGIGGRPLVLQEGDMHVHDDAGIISSVVYGPDDRTKLMPSTRQAVFCVYAPAGISPDAVERHLEEIASGARLIAPEAAVVQQQVFTAS